MAGEMDLPDARHREPVEITLRIEATVDDRDVDVVHVEEETASGALGEPVEELDLAHRAAGEADIACRVLDQDLPAEPLLHGIELAGDELERGLGIGERQEIFEIGAAEIRPGEMLRDERRPVAFDDAREAIEMAPVETIGTAERQPDAVDRERKAVADALEHAMRRAAIAHEVLGVDLEPGGLGRAVEDGAPVLGLEPDPGARRDRARVPDAGRATARHDAHPSFSHGSAAASPCAWCRP